MIEAGSHLKLLSTSPYETLPREPLLWASARRIRPSPRLSRELNCEEWAYRSASNILHKSQVPVFVQPGDNNINDCNNVLNAEELWTKYFRRIYKWWDHDFAVTRCGDLIESVLFLWG